MVEYIERDVALKALCQVSAPTPSESYVVEKCIGKLNDVPAAEVAPVVHARWVLRQSNGYAVCSHCCHGDHVDPMATHCRYCGAKMDLEA